MLDPVDSDVDHGDDHPSSAIAARRTCVVPAARGTGQAISTTDKLTTCL